MHDGGKLFPGFPSYFPLCTILGGSLQPLTMNLTAIESGLFVVVASRCLFLSLSSEAAKKSWKESAADDDDDDRDEREEAAAAAAGKLGIRVAQFCCSAVETEKPLPEER